MSAARQAYAPPAVESYDLPSPPDARKVLDQIQYRSPGTDDGTARDEIVRILTELFRAAQIE